MAPKKEGFKDEILESHPNMLLNLNQHGHSFFWQACPPWPPPEPLHQLGPSIVVRAGYQKTVGNEDSKSKARGGEFNLLALHPETQVWDLVEGCCRLISVGS